MIVQGGQAPCFSTHIADFIVYGEVHCPENIEYIPDREIYEKLTKVTKPIFLRNVARYHYKFCTTVVNSFHLTFMRGAPIYRRTRCN